ncbi:MAG: 23S rRNA (pseudouridine(1915)-N(3))-methyltransferase RlmH [Neomegalonema sp.]|nr:23S rRNA (pseudouridine(1915)-N(3))-methyltransferase RlmH [Neomegalonema sp.]
MKLLIAAIARLPKSPETALVKHYADRINGLSRSVRLGPVALRELEDKSRKGREAESSLLLSAAQEAERYVVLDERGRALSSMQLAGKLGDWRDEGVAQTAFLIGGADGHTDALRDRADLLLSFGALTWPHGLARVMLLEQLYRCATILAGHPYHREG